LFLGTAFKQKNGLVFIIRQELPDLLFAAQVELYVSMFGDPIYIKDEGHGTISHNSGSRIDAQEFQDRMDGIHNDLLNADYLVHNKAVTFSADFDDHNVKCFYGLGLLPGDDFMGRPFIIA
jgi:hypothetical protein